MKRELGLGLGVLLVMLACDDARNVDVAVGVGGRPGTGGRSDATAGRAATGAATSTGGAGSPSPGGAGSAGDSAQLRYCSASYDEVALRALFRCPLEFCASLTSAVSMSDGGTFISRGAEVRAGRCAAPGEAFDAVYFGTGVGSECCYYREGALVGIATWGDSYVTLSNGCSIFLGPVVWGEVPDSALTGYLKGCSGLTTYRTMQSSVSGTAGAAGAAGAPNGPPLGNCYEVATATCGPC